MTPGVHAKVMANEGLSVFGRNGLRAFLVFERIPYSYQRSCLVFEFRAAMRQLFPLAVVCFESGDTSGMLASFAPDLADGVKILRQNLLDGESRGQTPRMGFDFFINKFISAPRPRHVVRQG